MTRSHEGTIAPMGRRPCTQGCKRKGCDCPCHMLDHKAFLCGPVRASHEDKVAVGRFALMLQAGGMIQ